MTSGNDGHVPSFVSVDLEKDGLGSSFVSVDLEKDGQGSSFLSVDFEKDGQGSFSASFRGSLHGPQSICSRGARVFRDAASI